MTEQTEVYLTSQELAHRWRLNPHTLNNWRVQGRGPEFVKMGKRVLYSIADIEAWEAQQKKQNTAQE